MELSGLPCALLLLLLASCSRRGAAGPGEVEVLMPEVLEVQVGETAHLRCDFFLPEGNYSYIKWFYLTKDQRNPIFYVYKGKGQANLGEFQDRLSLVSETQLDLARVTPRDEGDFVCQVGATDARTQENRTQLRVYKAPEEPTIQITTTGISVTNKNLEEIANCVGKNGYPAPNVTWYKNRTSLKQEKDKVNILSTRIKESNGLYTVSSHLWAQLEKGDENARFYCELSYRLPGGEHMLESKDVTIPIFYPSEKVWLEVSPVAPLKEGDTVVLQCQADGNPPPEFTYWKKDAAGQWQELKDTRGGPLTLKTVSREDSGHYQCRGLDLDALTELIGDEQQLLVNYVSNVRVHPKVAVGHEGGSLTVNCTAESNLPLDFQWQREKGSKILATGPILHLSDLSRDTAGGYRCVASVPGVAGLARSKPFNVSVHRSPRVTAKPGRVPVHENELVNLTCEASGHPQPKLSWSTNGTVLHQTINHHVLSTLSVLVTPELLETGVVCQATNKLGSNATTILLELVSFTTLTPGITAVPNSTPRADPTGRTNPNGTSTGDAVHKEHKRQESKGVVIVAIIVCILVLAVLGAVLYFLHKKGKLPCGRSGKQDITLPAVRKDEIVVEVKSDKLPEEMGLLQGTNGNKRAAGDQGEKYIDVKH
ncbi:cell surface glycoprotein MUC18 isoform X1 [Ornithorhynchus anatinus]|uniref:cell surface glycoprotein MUC18 isoform X1 n=1 Tax=Ornithorhynchus anatinus TaxID=9258 RepID=UPI0010A76C5B|nr:cell surface glycoprotein MUC18 isoform X1 [Ornithorhynchus anatinus]